MDGAFAAGIQLAVRCGSVVLAVAAVVVAVLLRPAARPGPPPVGAGAPPKARAGAARG